MPQNYWILIIALIELLLFYLFAYSIKVARKWVNNKIEDCQELSSELPALSRKFRKELRLFNYSIKKRFVVQPLTSTEIISVLSEIGAEFIRSKIPVFSINGKFMFMSIILKLWKLRRRIIATFTQRVTRSAY